MVLQIAKHLSSVTPQMLKKDYVTPGTVKGNHVTFWR